MTLQEAVELLCEKVKYYAQSGDIVVKMVDPSWEHFDLSTIDSCLALGHELGLVLEFNWTSGQWRSQWHMPDRIGIGGEITKRHPTELAAIQSALAAGIEHLYGVPT